MNRYKEKFVVIVNITILWLVTLYSLVKFTEVSAKGRSIFNRIRGGHTPENIK
jgi:hypothetical protein